MRKECYIFSILFTPTCNIWYQHYPWHVWSWSHFVQSKCWKYKKPVIEDIRRTVFQYHKANIEDLKAKLLHFQNQFLTSDECSTSVEANWLSFKHAIDEAMRKYIPQKTCKSTNDLPWLTYSIKKMMKQRKRLYKLARSLQTEEAWSNYRKLKNKITNSIRESHNNYQNNLFLQDGELNHKQFWRYIKCARKDHTGVALLNVNSTDVYNRL